MVKKKLKLTIELVPSSAWQNNLRNILKSHMWKNLRESVYKKSDYKCSICGNAGILHAHEVWEYDDKNHIQKLKDIVALCKDCHAVKHIGLAGLQASKGEINYDRLIKHFIKVNGCDKEAFIKHRSAAFKKFEERSKYDWTLDLKS